MNNLPETAFEWEMKSKLKFVVYVVYGIWSLIVLDYLFEGVLTKNYLLIGFIVFLILLWGYVIVRTQRGFIEHVSLSDRTISFWTESKKPYQGKNVISRFINKYDQTISNRNRVLIHEEAIKEIYIPLGRDRIIIRLKNGKCKIIELNHCQEEAIKVQLLLSVEHYWADYMV